MHSATEPAIEDESRWLRQKQVAALLGVSRHTLARIVKGDPTFPRFVELSPGVRVVRERLVRRWLAEKEFAARAVIPDAQRSPS